MDLGPTGGAQLERPRTFRRIATPALPAAACLARALVATLAILSVFAPPGRTQSCLDYGKHLRWLSSLTSGNPNDVSGLSDVVAIGKLACVAEFGDAGLVVIDLSDPAHPVRRGSASLPLNDIRSLAAAGTLVFATSADSALALIDITDPDTPALKGTLPTAFCPHALALLDSVVVVVGGEPYGGQGGAQVFSLSATGEVRARGLLTLGSSACSAALSGGLAFVVCSDGPAAGLHVIDVSSLDDPREIGHLALSGRPAGVAVVGARAYVTMVDIGVGVVDIGDPARPRLLWTTLLDGAEVIETDGSHLLVGAWNRWEVYGLAVPDRPYWICGAPCPGGGYAQVVSGIAVHEGNVLLSSMSSEYYEEGGLHVFAAEGMQAATLRSALAAVPDGALDVALWCGCAYVLTPTSLEAVDLGEPDAPRWTARLPLEGGVRSRLEAANGVLYRAIRAANDSVGIEIFGLDDPDVPEPQGGITFPLDDSSWPYVEMAAAADLVCIARWDTLVVLRGDAERGLRVVSRTPFPDTIGPLLQIGTILYVGRRGLGVAVFDLSDPTAPRQVALVPEAPYPRLFAPSGTTLFAHSSRGIVAFDISAPATPRHLGQVASPYALNDLAATGGFLYAPGRTQVHVFDARSPQSMRYLGAAETRGEGAAVAAAGERIAVAGDFGTSNGTAGFALAWPQCGAVVAVDLRSFRAEPADRAVVLRWSLAGDWEQTEFRLLAHAEGAAWEVPFEALGDGSFFAHDLSAGDRPGVEIVYALERREPDGEWSLLASERVRVENALPAALRLIGAYPNPFNPLTTIGCDLPAATHVRLAVYDQRGRLVRVLVDGRLPAGHHDLPWDGRDARGQPAASGTYVARLVTEQGSRSSKLTLTR